MIDPKREAETVVAGERTSTPVSGKVVDGNRAFARRGIAVCALIVFGAFFIWGGWGRAKTGNEDRATKPVVSLRTPYEAPRDPEPPARPQASGSGSGAHARDQAAGWTAGALAGR